MEEKVARFQHIVSKEQYILQHVRPCEPMTAKEIEKEEDQDKLLKNGAYIVEEKFDGTRALLHFYSTKSSVNTLFCTDKEYPNILVSFSVAVSKMLGDKLYSAFTEDDPTFSKVRDILCSIISKSSGFQIGNFSVKWDHSSVIVDEGKPTYTMYTWDVIISVMKDLFDRGGLYPSPGYCRCFSRRISVKTDWYTENTDSVPQLRDICLPEFHDTIIDGEMFIDGRPFKDVASILNCSWDKAVDRQKEIGKITFHAFDILYYKGIRVEKMPLHRRKELLSRVVSAAGCDNLIMVPYYPCDAKIPVEGGELVDLDSIKHKYPQLYKDLSTDVHCVTPKGYYEYIVYSGGEGVIIKDFNGKYFHKRGREYQKIKKFLTREVIIMGFSSPTKEYTGKFPNNRWDYWITPEGYRANVHTVYGIAATTLLNRGYTPVTRFWYEGLVGNIVYGVIITDDEIKHLPKNKHFIISDMEIEGKYYKVVNVGECAGFDDDQRLLFSCNALDINGEPIRVEEEDIYRYDLYHLSYIGRVIEVKANELFKDTGKMRHPRFLRMRDDKSPLSCTWKDHIGG